MAMTEGELILQVAEQANRIAPNLKERVAGQLSKQLGMHFGVEDLPDVEFKSTPNNQANGKSWRGSKSEWGGVPVIRVTHVFIHPEQIGVEADTQVEGDKSKEEAALELMVRGMLFDMPYLDIREITKRVLDREENENV